MVSATTARPVRVHLPWTAVVFPVLLFFCITPLATAGGAWLILYIFPSAMLLTVIFGGTTATATHLSARWWRGPTRLRWDEVHELRFSGPRWAVAVTTSGRRVLLPGVRPLDLPRIVAVAGGRLFLQRPTEPGASSNPDNEPAAHVGH